MDLDKLVRYLINNGLVKVDDIPNSDAIQEAIVVMEGMQSALTECENRIADLEEELRVTDSLLNERMRVMREIPECPAHGDNCVPHAIDWVKKQKASE